MRQLISLIFFIAICSVLNTQTVYNHYIGNDGSVNKILIDGDYIYVGGSFEYVGSCVGFGAKLNINDASADLSFPKINGTINWVLADDNNGWFIGGSFSKVGNKKAYNFAKIDINGNIDQGWLKKFNSDVTRMIKDGSYLYVAGYFDEVEGKKTRGICRFNLQTKALDYSYLLTDTNMPNLYDIRIYQDYIYFCDARTIIRLNKNNLKIDTTFKFSNRPGRYIKDFDVGADGLYYAAGYYVYRCSLTTGGHYANFKPTFDDEVWAVKVINRKAYVGGGFWYVNNQQKTCLARLTYDTGQLESWGGFTISWVTRLYPCKNYLYATGSLKYLGGTALKNFGRVSYSTGYGSSSWSPNINSLVLGVDESGNYVYVGGKIGIANNVLRKNLYKIKKSDGSLVEGFLADFDGTVYDIAKDGNKLYVVGEFNQAKGYDLKKFARIDANSAFPDYEYKLDADNAIKQIQIDGDYIYLCGNFNSINNTQAKSLAKINKNTRQIVQNWTPSIEGKLYGFLIYGDYIYVYGMFSKLGEYPIRNLGRIRKDNGMIDPNFSFQINNYVGQALIYGDYIYIAGSFWEIDSEIFRHFARINIRESKLDKNFKYEFYYINYYGDKVYEVPALVGIYGGELYINGGIEYVNDRESKNFIAINLNQNNINLEKSLSLEGSIYAVAFEGNKIYLGGYLSVINEEPVPNFAAVEFNISKNEKELNAKPEDFHVTEPYPNPFNSAARLKINLPTNGSLRAKIYDITGRIIYEDNLGEYEKGELTYSIDGERLGLASGVYYVEFTYKIKETFSKKVRKFMYLK